MIEDMMQRVIEGRVLGMTWTQLSRSCGASRSTLYRLLNNGMIQDPEAPSFITDDDLNSIVNHILTEHPSYGESRVRAMLEMQNLKVRRERIRKAIVRNIRGLDPAYLTRINRRVYRSLHSMQVWHPDSNCKLSACGLYVQHIVDGHSRRIVMARLHTVIDSRSHLASYSDAVQTYGIPMFLRLDYGSENEGMAYLHQMYWQSEQSVIAGKSTRNTRVERPWRDLNVDVMYPWIRRPNKVTKEVDFQHDHPLHRSIIHISWFQQINSDVQTFAEVHNHHRMRNLSWVSPIQYFNSTLPQERNMVTNVDEWMKNVDEVARMYSPTMTSTSKERAWPYPSNPQFGKWVWAASVLNPSSIDFLRKLEHECPVENFQSPSDQIIHIFQEYSEEIEQLSKEYNRIK